MATAKQNITTSIWSHRQHTVFIEYAHGRYDPSQNASQELYREILNVVNTLPENRAISYMPEITAQLAPATLTMKVWLPDSHTAGFITEARYPRRLDCFASGNNR